MASVIVQIENSPSRLRFRFEQLSSGAMKFFSILLMAVGIFAVSCERHDFEGPEGSKQLHKKHEAYPPNHETEDGEQPAH